MDADRFATVLRCLTATPSRRFVARALSGLAVSGALASRLWPSRRTGQEKEEETEEEAIVRAARGATAPPPPPCVPQDLATVCAAGCGTRSDNCGRSVDCPCPADRVCLANGGCAQECSPFAGNCPSGCGCAMGSAEGPRRCYSLVSCFQIPQLCSTTADCPPGQHCQVTLCGAIGTSPYRCAPLCTA